jgi:hypothetical protein
MAIGRLAAFEEFAGNAFVVVQPFLGGLGRGAGLRRRRACPSGLCLLGRSVPRRCDRVCVARRQVAIEFLQVALGWLIAANLQAFGAGLHPNRAAKSLLAPHVDGAPSAMLGDRDQVLDHLGVGLAGH